MPDMSPSPPQAPRDADRSRRWTGACDSRPPSLHPPRRSHTQDRRVSGRDPDRQPACRRPPPAGRRRSRESRGSAAGRRRGRRRPACRRRRAPRPRRAADAARRADDNARSARGTSEREVRSAAFQVTHPPVKRSSGIATSYGDCRGEPRTGHHVPPFRVTVGLEAGPAEMLRPIYRSIRPTMMYHEFMPPTIL